MNNQKKTAISRLGQCRRILSQRYRPPVLSLAILLLFTSAALAQLTTADILGTVMDQTGASVPNARVTLTNLGTNDQRTVQSSGSGDYTFTLLPVGRYSISVKAGGFQESITNPIGVPATREEIM
jgi:Carboxypeptidase regulatory-like domain